MKDLFELVKKKHAEYSTYVVWAISWCSVFGSLYFSEIAGYVPCALCWWQRLLIYPLAIISTVAIVRKEFKSFAYYALSFSVLGMIISFYHSLLQWGIIEHNVLDCSAGGAVSCSDPEIMVFGFITIPFLAFVSFSVITIVSVASLVLAKKEN